MSYLASFLRYSKIWSKIVHVNLIHLPPLGVTPSEFRRDLWQQKTRVPELSCGIVCGILHLAIFV